MHSPDKMVILHAIHFPTITFTIYLNNIGTNDQFKKWNYLLLQKHNIIRFLFYRIEQEKKQVTKKIKKSHIKLFVSKSTVWFALN